MAYSPNIENAPSKPNWDDAPEWANYLALDPDGWYWFEHQPDILGGVWTTTTGEMDCAKYQTGTETINWRKSLEERSL